MTTNMICPLVSDRYSHPDQLVHYTCNLPAGHLGAHHDPTSGASWQPDAQLDRRLDPPGDARKPGVWVVYDHDQGPFAISVHTTAENAVRSQAGGGYGRIGYWPYGVELAAAVNEWEGRS